MFLHAPIVQVKIEEIVQKQRPTFRYAARLGHTDQEFIPIKVLPEFRA
jgi:hypothetical protein